MKLIFVRHGETLFNELKLTQGWCDSPLTKQGIEQARAAGENLKDIAIDEAYSSTSERAYDTADIILEGRRIEIRRDKRLKELNFGYYEGSSDVMRWKLYPSGENRMRVEDYRSFGGESHEDVIEREMDFLRELTAGKEEKTVLIAGHGLSLTLLVRHIAEKSLEERFPEFFFFMNAMAVIVNEEDGCYEVEAILKAQEDQREKWN